MGSEVVNLFIKVTFKTILIGTFKVRVCRVTTCVRPYAATAAAATALICGEMLCRPVYAAPAPLSSPFIPGWGTIPNGLGYEQGTANGVRRPGATRDKTLSDKLGLSH